MRHLLTLTIFVGFLALYLFSVGIPFYSSDGLVMYETARAIAFDGRLDIPHHELPQVIEGREGRYYSKYDPGMSLLAAPVVAYADQVAQGASANRYAVGAIFVILVPAASMALGVASTAVIARRFYTPRLSLLIAIVAGAGTMAWPYGRLFFSEAVLTGALCLSIAALTAQQPRVGLASVALGIGILTRASMMIYLPGLVYLIWQQHSPPDRRRHLVWLIIGAVVAIGVLLWHNWLRFGTLFSTGYQGETFDTWPWVGIFGLLFSPGKSIFIYAPPLILSVLLWRRFRRRTPILANAVLLMTATAFVYYGTWWAWHGGWVWGPRFLVPLMPLWCLAWGEVPSRIGWRLAAAMILLVGIGVQLIGTFSDINPTYAEAFAGATDPDDRARYAMVHYHLDKTPLVMALKRRQWEEQAIYNLQSTDLTEAWVYGIPRVVHWMLALSAGFMGWIIVTGREPAWHLNRNSTTADRQ